MMGGEGVRSTCRVKVLALEALSSWIAKAEAYKVRTNSLIEFARMLRYFVSKMYIRNALVGSPMIGG